MISRDMHQFHTAKSALLALAIKLIRTPALQWRTNALGLHLQKTSNASPQSGAHNLGAKCFTLLKSAAEKLDAIGPGLFNAV
jgi:hypothetical protein